MFRPMRVKWQTDDPGQQLELPSTHSSLLPVSALVLVPALPNRTAEALDR
jgi:hypothetical protein